MGGGAAAAAEAGAGPVVAGSSAPGGRCQTTSNVRAPSLRGAIGRGHAKARLLPRLRVLPRVLLPWVLLPHVSLLPPQDFCGHELTPRLRKVGTPASAAVKAHIEKVRTPTAGGELHCPPASRALSLSDWLSTYNVIIAWRLRRTGA